MRALALLALLASTSLPATAATLRPMTTLAAPVVRLSDLFDDAGPDAGRALGPAPAPGGRIIVEAAQLAAIARQFGVDWRPASPGDRAVLDRPGRLLPRDQALGAIRDALGTAGVAPDSDIELTGFAPPLLPAESTARPVATDLAYDPASGRFTAVLSVVGDGMEPVSVRVAGRALEMIELPVAATHLAPGSIVGASDLRPGRVRGAGLRAEVARLPGQAIGLQLRHSVSPGQPLPLSDLERPAMVQKGALVAIALNSPGLTLAAQGQAMEAGAIGDRIRVMNPASRAVVLAEVTAEGQVRVDPGAMPLVAAARSRTEMAAR